MANEIIECGNFIFGITDDGCVYVDFRCLTSRAVFDKLCSEILTELFRKQGWLDEEPKEEYEVVEVTSFDGLKVGDVLCNTNEVVTGVHEQRASINNEQDKYHGCIYQIDIDRIGPLKVRRRVKPVEWKGIGVISGYAGCEYVSIPFHPLIMKAGFQPKDQVEITVKKVHG